MARFYVSQFAQSGTTEDPERKGIPVLFDPDNEDHGFVIFVHPVTPKELARMGDESTRGRRGTNTVKFNELLAGKVIKGWSGLTPEAARDLRLFSFSDEGFADFKRTLEADGTAEIPYSAEQAVDLMNTSLRFSQRVNELASELDALEAAKEAYRRFSSRLSAGTGPAARG